MKKFTCLILSLILVLGLLGGCSGNNPLKPAGQTDSSTEATQTDAPSQEAASTAAPTEPDTTAAPIQPVTEPAPATEAVVPTTEAPEIRPVSATEAYDQAVEKLPADYHLILRIEISRQMDKELLITEETRTVDVSGTGTEDMKVSGSWSRTVEGNVSEDSHDYVFGYSGGKAFISNGKAVFTAKQSPEEFLKGQPPLALLTPDNYESIEYTDDSRSAILFSEANDTEWEWLGMDCTDVTRGEGTVSLDDNGNIVSIVYDTEYALEGISFTAHVTAELSPLIDAVKMPAVNNGPEVSVTDINIVPLMELALYGFYTEDMTASLLSITQSYAAGTTLLKQEWLGLGKDEAGPMVYDHTYSTFYSQNTESSEYELRHFGGKTAYTEDGEETPFSTDPEELEQNIVDYLVKAWVFPDELKTASLSDEYDCWLIEFTVGTDRANDLRGFIEEELFGDSSRLESIGARFKLNSCTGYLSIDKGSGMAVHLKVDFDAAHTYQKQNYPLMHEYEWIFRAADPDAWYMITEELRPSEMPAEPATPLFYKVTAPNGHSMWLLGTIHIGDERTAHLPKEIYDALLSSDALAVEIDVTNMEERLEADDELMKAYQESTYYSDNKDAYEHIEDEELKENLETALKKYGGEIRVKWLLYKVASVNSLLEQEMLEMGRMHSYDRGVDNQLVKMAKDSGIEVWDVEDYAEHISLLGGFSDKLQELLLKETIDAGRYGSNMGTMALFDKWCRGDEAELTESLSDEEDEEDEELTPEEQALVDEYNHGMMEKRNAEMVEKAKEYLAQDKTVFFAVGLAHLLDEDGLLICLREAGYTVEQVSFAAAEP